MKPQSIASNTAPNKHAQQQGNPQQRCKAEMPEASEAARQAARQAREHGVWLQDPTCSLAKEVVRARSGVHAFFLPSLPFVGGDPKVDNRSLTTQ